MGYRVGPIFWGLVFIGLGILFLAQQLSDGGFSVGQFFARYWPLLIVLLGLWFIVRSFFGRTWGGGPGGGWSGGPGGGGPAGGWSGGPGRWRSSGEPPGWGPQGGPGWDGGPAGAQAAGGAQAADAQAADARAAGGAPAGWAPGEPASIDLQGAESAEVSFSFGAGELVVGRAGSGKLVEGTFGGGVRAEQGGPGRVRLSGEAPWGWGPGWWRRSWRTGVTGDVPLILNVETGASRNELDLSELRVTDLSVRTGASETTIRLPRAAGLTRARLDAGAASVRIWVPEGVAVRILGRMQIGTNDIDTRRFPETTTGWASPDFDTAENRVELAISGGLATLQIR